MPAQAETMQPSTSSVVERSCVSPLFATPHKTWLRAGCWHDPWFERSREPPKGAARRSVPSISGCACACAIIRTQGPALQPRRSPPNLLKSHIQTLVGTSIASEERQSSMLDNETLIPVRVSALSIPPPAVAGRPVSRHQGVQTMRQIVAEAPQAGPSGPCDNLPHRQPHTTRREFHEGAKGASHESKQRPDNRCDCHQ